MSSLSKYNKGVTLLLVVIDIFFLDFYGSNRKKNKIAKEVVKGFKEIIQKGRKYKKNNLEQIKDENFQTDCYKSFFFSLKT